MQLARYDNRADPNAFSDGQWGWETAFTQLGIQIQEAPIGVLDPLFRPEEVFLTNSVRGLVPVREWGEARFQAPGPVARRLWEDARTWLESGGETP